MSTWKKFSAAGLGAAMLLSGALPAAASDPLQSVSPAAVQSLLKQAGSSSVVSTTTSSVQNEAQTDVKISKEEAIALAKKLVEVPDSYTLQGIYLNGPSSASILKEGSRWSVEFSKFVRDRNYGSINVTVDANTGKLIGYNRYENDPDKKPVFPPKVDFQEAKRIALDYVTKYNADEIKDTRYNDLSEKNFKTPLNGDVRYHIQYDRTINGIPFPQNYITVEVDGDGQVVGYTTNWNTDVPAESAEGAISLEQAKLKLNALADLYVTYQLPYELRGTDRKVLTAYQGNVPTLDAKTGEAINYGGAAVNSVKKDRTPLTEAPLGEAPAAGEPLNKEQAVKKVTQLFVLPEGSQLEDATYSEQKNQNEDELQANWNIRWSSPAEDNDSMRKDQVWASVNGKTGEVRHFTRNNIIIMNKEADGKEASAADNKLTWDEAKGKAVDFVKTIVPYRTNQLYLENVKDEEMPQYKLFDSPSYQFRFTRVIDGVLVNSEGIYVSIDRKSGTVVSYDNNFSNIDYPEKKPQLITAEQAKERLLNQYSLELQYLVQVKGGAGSPIPYNMPVEKYHVMVAAGEIKPVDGAEQAVKLAYVPIAKNAQLGELFLDAKTGEWKQLRDGEAAMLVRSEATDIIGHRAEKELRMMAEYGALEVLGGKLSPERVMTRGEMIKMLVIAMNGGGGPVFVAESRKATFADVGRASPYFAYVENAVDRQLIDRDVSSFKPDALMTRQDMADLIVRALGYQQLAKVQGLFALDVSDAAQITDKGSAAIVLSLGIVAPVDGAFKPAAEVSRADAAVSFYRYLQKRSELQQGHSPFYGW